ncbi:protein inturned [Caerostris extrusa]|uniref:Protein inturned n=1 Tax=Caerostris extrusa TaxID=172846 RepID=A0AAV4QK33_CAEEX|nr:protein inturned [Caerostris extrusa]
MFITLSHMISDIASPPLLSCSLTIQGELIHASFVKEGNGTFVLAFPGKCCTISESQHFVTDLVKLLKFQFSSLKINILHYYPYKVTHVQELLPAHLPVRHTFALEFLVHMEVDSDWPWNFSWTDEAHFSLFGFVNTQNCKDMGRVIVFRGSGSRTRTFNSKRYESLVQPSHSNTSTACMSE